jgi:hypothetical protein
MITSSMMPPAMPITAETIEVATVHAATTNRTWEENTALIYSWNKIGCILSTDQLNWIAVVEKR